MTVVGSASHMSQATRDFMAQFRSPKLSQVGSSLKFLLVRLGHAHIGGGLRLAAVAVSRSCCGPISSPRRAWPLSDEEGGSVRSTDGGAQVAEGLAHVYPRLAPTCEWDTAAAHIIVEEAGGSVIQVRRSPDPRPLLPSRVRRRFATIFRLSRMTQGLEGIEKSFADLSVSRHSQVGADSGCRARRAGPSRVMLSCLFHPRPAPCHAAAPCWLPGLAVFADRACLSPTRGRRLCCPGRQVRQQGPRARGLGGRSQARRARRLQQARCPQPLLRRLRRPRARCRRCRRRRGGSGSALEAES